MLKSQQEIENKYKLRATALVGTIDGLKKSIDKLSMVRIALLLVEIAFFVFFLQSANDTEMFWRGALLALPIAVFILAVKKQNALSKNKEYLSNLLWVYENELTLLRGNENKYAHGENFKDENHAYTADLDIFGRSSLFALLNRCVTKVGTERLAQSLAFTDTKDGIVARQEAIREMASHIDRTFELRANLKGHDVSQIEQIKQKLKGPLAEQLQFTRNKPLRLYVKLLPYVASILTLAAIVVGGKLWTLLMLIAFINATLTFGQGKKINKVYYGFSGGSALLNDYATAIKWTEEINWQSSYIRSLFSSTKQVSVQIKKLAQIIQAFDARLNILLSAILNFFFLWDLDCCIKLDQWNTTAEVENGLDRIGYFEELISMATLVHNEPAWTFPLIDEGFSLSATGLGHPLIKQQGRVYNDYQLEAQATVDIVTGSNMAGKSTFLRTVGINMILAYAGAPVCASQMRLSIFKLVTYMRIVDSLKESTSTFKAELNRLKMILSTVKTTENAMVLIDEMLRGTNSRDKYLGSKVFIEKMIELRVPTLFATHDLQLSELQVIYAQTVRNFHFDIQLAHGEMSFDYQLKHGPCSTFNAAILLKEIGLALDEQH